MGHHNTSMSNNCILLTIHSPIHCCVCPKPAAGFYSTYVVVYFMFIDLREVVVHFVDIGGICLPSLLKLGFYNSFSLVYKSCKIQLDTKWCIFKVSVNSQFENYFHDISSMNFGENKIGFNQDFLVRKKTILNKYFKLYQIYLIEIHYLIHIFVCSLFIYIYLTSYKLLGISLV